MTSWPQFWEFRQVKHTVRKRRQRAFNRCRNWMNNFWLFLVKFGTKGSGVGLLWRLSRAHFCLVSKKFCFGLTSFDFVGRKISMSSLRLRDAWNFIMNRHPIFKGGIREYGTRKGCLGVLEMVLNILPLYQKEVDISFWPVLPRMPALVINVHNSTQTNPKFEYKPKYSVATDSVVQMVSQSSMQEGNPQVQADTQSTTTSLGEHFP